MLLIGLPMVTVSGQECERSGVTYYSVRVGCYGFGLFGWIANVQESLTIRFALVFMALVFLVGSGNRTRELVVRVSALGKNEGEFGFLSVSLIVGLSR